MLHATLAFEIHFVTVHINSNWSGTAVNGECGISAQVNVVHDAVGDSIGGHPAGAVEEITRV